MSALLPSARVSLQEFASPLANLVLDRMPVPNQRFVEKCVGFQVEFGQAIIPDMRLQAPFGKGLAYVATQILLLFIETFPDGFNRLIYALYSLDPE